jgi:hypothetical protein
MSSDVTTFTRSRGKLTDIGFHLEVVEDCHEEVGLRRRFQTHVASQAKYRSRSQIYFALTTDNTQKIYPVRHKEV